MGYNQLLHSNRPEQSVQIPLDIKHISPNQTSHSKQRLNKWFTIIICIIFVGTGQSIVRLLENYYYLHTNQSLYNRKWTQALLQVVGFPLLILPFLLFIILSSKKKIQLLITSKGTNLLCLTIYYIVISVYMVVQATLSNRKHEIPFIVFSLIYSIPLLLIPVFTNYFNDTKFNRWMIISLIFAILTSVFTVYTLPAGAGSPIYNGEEQFNYRGILITAAVFFSMLLCTVEGTCDMLISESNDKKRPSFATVLELLLFSCLFSTFFFVAAIFISGDHHHIKREMDLFSDGEVAYMWTMVGQAAAWQIYWIGIVGLVFAVSAVFSNVISVCTWHIASLLVSFSYNTYEKQDVFGGAALATAALSIASYFYLILKEKSRDCDEAKS